LAALHLRKFLRKQNDSGTYDFTCPVCNRTIGPVRIEPALEELQESHLCLEADPIQRKSEPAPFERSGMDFQAPAPERVDGAPAESLDVKTTPDVEIGSVGASKRS
jgi:hypothetical protein